MARLAQRHQLTRFNDCFEQLEAICEDKEYPKTNVYGALLYVHLIDLDERRDPTARSKYRDEFKAALVGSKETTQAHFEPYIKNESSPILASLKFNYL